jgi:hypothetical protein
MLHLFGRHADVTAYHSYPAALAALAAIVRADWAEITYRDDVPAGPDGLSDAEAVLLYFRGNGGPGGREAPTFGMSFAGECGFAIGERVVAGPEPSAVSLRMGTFRVSDPDPDPADTDVPAVTYCLDAAGLSVDVTTGADGNPSVLITPHSQLTGLPVTVRLEDPVRPGGFTRTYRVS